MMFQVVKGEDISAISFDPNNNGKFIFGGGYAILVLLGELNCSWTIRRRISKDYT